jgi:hypothetical protein
MLALSTWPGSILECHRIELTDAVRATICEVDEACRCIDRRIVRVRPLVAARYERARNVVVQDLGAPPEG